MKGKQLTSRTALAICAMLLISSAVEASDLPRYDPKKFCREVANVSGGSAMIEEGCMQIEQQAYNNLKSSWASYPERARNFCNQVANTSGGAYQILEGCIQQEVQTGSTSEEFQY